MQLYKKLFCAVLLVSLAHSAAADGDVELVDNMQKLQYFLHKAALAVDNKNQPLAEFYAHELEEFMEEAAEVETYDGHPVGKLVESMLMPSFEKFESSLKAGDWQKTSANLDQLAGSCNACHSATEHGFIQIERRRDNPFMQTFTPQK